MHLFENLIAVMFISGFFELFLICFTIGLTCHVRLMSFVHMFNYFTLCFCNLLCIPVWESEKKKDKSKDIWTLFSKAMSVVCQPNLGVCVCSGVFDSLATSWTARLLCPWIFQARISYSRGSSQPRDRAHLLHCRQILYHCVAWEAQPNFLLCNCSMR